MQLSGNTILITGGGSGIGRGLAEELLKLDNEVIIAGRRREALEATVAANPGMKAIVLDIESESGIREFAAKITSSLPRLNVLVNNAGIMRAEKLLAQQEDLADAEAIVRTNLLGPIRLTAALLPHLKQQPHGAIVNVTSGLAYVPLVLTPTYSATKAALHSYTESLRWQLRKTGLEVIELVPPYVQTHLMNGAEDPRAMPLVEFIDEVISIWKQQPTPKEICVERVKHLRNAAAEGRYDATFNGLSNAMAGEL
jgi:uncharacterized oxidoreductase